MVDQASPAQTKNALEHDQLKRLEMFSIIEATTLVLLVCVAVPLKHVYDWPLGSKILGPVHGIAFLIYSWTVLQTVAAGGWRGVTSRGFSLSPLCRSPATSILRGFAGNPRRLTSHDVTRDEVKAMEFYPYLVAAHVTAVVFFVGGLLAHDIIMNAAARLPQPQQAGTLEILFQLDRRVTSPALLLTWVLGLSLAVWAGWFPSTWLVVKLIFVVALSALHGMQSGRLRRLVRDGEPAKGIRGAAVAIVIAMLAIAILAIVKPG